MPAAMEDGENAGIDALDLVCDNLTTPAFMSAIRAKESDVNFLSELLNSPTIQSLVQVHDLLEEAELEPLSCESLAHSDNIIENIDELGRSDRNLIELKQILSSPFFRALLLAHDDIAAKNYGEELEELPAISTTPPPEMFNTVTPPTDAIRMVSIRKNPNEPLGMTVKKQPEGLIVTRILKGSAIESLEILHVGDVIKEINGQEVKDPDVLMELMRKASGNITLKTIPSYFDQSSTAQIYLKCYFSYDPMKDNLIPCREAGLKFHQGDILQVVNMDDPNWWQARKVDQNGPTGLIPSQTLEEKRKAFVPPEYDYSHKSLLCGLMTKKTRKVKYQAKLNSTFDRSEIMVYEEVARMPPFQRKTLVLVGAPGVGRRTLKQRLIKADPSRFGSATPHTSRAQKPDEVNGAVYWFVTREEMEYDIAKGKYLEFGEFEGNLYGTKYDAIRHVIHSGQMCILDASSQALKGIKTPEFMPYVVFIAAPPVEILRNMHEYARQRGKTDKIKTERDFRKTLEESAEIERNYKQYFDMSIVNDNMDDTYNKLRKAIETLSTEPQWVPTSWVY